MLVQLQLGGAERDLSLLEFEELVASAGGEPVATITGSRSAPHARTFVGEGKLEEIAAACQTHSAELVIFNHALSPSQERNLERTLSCRVLARTGLILDIFAQRARTHEGKLQVELAQLTHMSTRLVRGWTHLERQKGGIGLRGPGETQLETDRRLLRARIKSIQARLERVRNQREQSRRARRRAELPVLSLVGYTNAGKSTLFNRLTGAEVMAKDMLFATLDPTMRRVQIPDGPEIILSDTVGFISNLPTELVAAFRATLEEVLAADVILHVRDISHEDSKQQAEDVEAILASLGVDENRARIEVWNKLDQLPEEEAEARRQRAEREDGIHAISALTGEGLDGLLADIAEKLQGVRHEEVVTLTFAQGKQRAWLFKEDLVQQEEQTETGFDITVLWTDRQRAKFDRL